MEITPWKVSGKPDYERIMKDFGTKPLDSHLSSRIESLAGETNTLISRGFFFCHRDLDVLLDDYEKGGTFFLYTGRGPSGRMHIGHIIPFLLCSYLQRNFGVNAYIEITDDEKYLVGGKPWAEVSEMSVQNILDICSFGFDPDRTFIFRTSEYIRNIYPAVCQISRKITLSTAKATFGFTGSTNIGLVSYPPIQMAPVFFEKSRCLIPAGVDQDPYFRLQRDISEKFGYPKPACIYSKFLPSLTGMEGKMSSSDPNSAVFLDDDEKTVERKVMKYAFSGGQPTVEEHRKKGGNTKIDVSFQWLRILFEESGERLDEIREEYESGRMLTGELKLILVEKLNRFLSEFRKRREKAEDMAEKMCKSGKLAKKMWDTVYDLES